MKAALIIVYLAFGIGVLGGLNGFFYLELTLRPFEMSDVIAVPVGWPTIVGIEVGRWMAERCYDPTGKDRCQGEDG